MMAAAGSHFLLAVLLCQASHAFSPIASNNVAVRNIVTVPKISASISRYPASLNRNSVRRLRMISEEKDDDASSEDDVLDRIDKDDDVEKAVDELSKETPKGFWESVKGAMKGKKEDEGLTFRQKLAKMGLSCALSYGWVSNMSYSVTVSLAWYLFSKQTGLSPLDKGQWKPFLAVYAGFYVFNNFVRPIRLALSVGVSRYFDNAVKSIERRMKVSRGVAIGILVFLANFVGTLAAMSFGIFIASTAAGVPIFPPKA